jgi:hypothetical protein
MTIFGLAELRLQSECGGVSTFRRARRYNRATPNQSSTLSLSNSAAALTSSLQAEQTFQQATQAQPLGPCPNRGWPKHSPDKLANTRQNRAFAQLSIQWVAATPARQLWINLKVESAWPSRCGCLAVRVSRSDSDRLVMARRAVSLRLVA